MCSISRSFGTKQAYYKQISTSGKKDLVEEVVLGLVKKKRTIWKKGSGRNLHQSLQKELKESRSFGNGS